jgi:uncharacterized protein YndB with AHSA1/START domain
MKNELHKELFLSQSPQEVWDYLTKPGLIKEWLGETDMQPIEGFKFRFISPYGNHSYCEVLEVKPFTKLVYSWQKNSATDNQPFTSIVTWTLIPKANGTELQLTHSGFNTQEDIDAHSNGWSVCLTQFKNLINKTLDSYTATIELTKPAADVFNAIKDVQKWWSKDFEGKSTNLNDEFVINHPNAHYSKQKLVEVVPDKKVVWLVTESKLNWLKKDQQEWTNTKMIFDINTKGDKTILQFTHQGLVPEKECHARCEQGWNMVIKDWLFNYITNGKTI